MPPDIPRVVAPLVLNLVNITYGKSYPPHPKFPATASDTVPYIFLHSERRSSACVKIHAATTLVL